MSSQTIEHAPGATSGDLSNALGMIAELQREVRWLRSKTDIHDLIVSYARACDRGNDPVMLRPLFTDDAVWECDGFGHYEGGDKVAMALKGIAGEKIWWSLHNMISPQIEIAPTGDTASAFWYLWEAATIPNEHSGDPEAYWIGGTYNANFRLVDGKWLFTRIELKLNMASPAGHAWVEKRFPDGTSKQPYFMQLEEGSYYWCACGKSKSQPFCDGSHTGGRIQPKEFTVEEAGLQVLCGCRYSRNKPFCDGSHLNLKL